MVKTVPINAPEETLAELLSQVRAGNEIIFSDGDIPIAKLAPVELNHVEHSDVSGHDVSNAAERTLGLHRGIYTIASDFDAPLSDEFWLGEET